MARHTRSILMFAVLLILLLLVTGIIYLASRPAYLPLDAGNISVSFCPRDGCGERMAEQLRAGTAIACAFYDFRIEEIQSVLREKHAPVLIDEDNAKYYPEGTPIVHEGLMHNKFCIIDDSIVLTGSFNPTMNDDGQNNNNFLVIHSRLLAQNYKEQFDDIRNGAHRPVRYPRVNLSGMLVENYFCPDDDCKGHVLATLADANSSIAFMLFSFTDDDIADLLVSSASRIDVHGVVDKTQASGLGAEYATLKHAGVTVFVDGNPRFLHHKVFIIDNATVITGSYNPTGAGNTKNDENILIIHDAGIARQYAEEFAYVYANATTSPSP